MKFDDQVALDMQARKLEEKIDKEINFLKEAIIRNDSEIRILLARIDARLREVEK